MSLSQLFRPSLNWLLICIPIAIGMHFAAPDSHTAIFCFACVSVIPLAGWMGKATEHLAEKTSEGIGGLLNATFGNAAELIIAGVALNQGKYEIVKASLTGSIIGNILLVLGAAFVVGGLRHREQKFSAGARIQATLLTLAAIGLIGPAAFHWSTGQEGWANEGDLSLSISVVLLFVYACGLLFSLKTHKHLFAGHSQSSDQAGEVNKQPWSVKKSLTVLAAATAMVAWVSEILVSSVDHAAESLGMNQVFVGVIIVAVIGNAAEHSTAILVARKNRMDLALGIAIGSSIQIALFVAPVLVLLGYAIGKPMDLVFTLPEVIAVALAVAVTGQIAEDGESNWLEGILLLAVYAILGLVFYYLPVT